MIRRRLAMRMAFTNKPEGKGYAQAFAELMKADGLSHHGQDQITAVLWLGDDPERMQDLARVARGHDARPALAAELADHGAAAGRGDPASAADGVDEEP